MNQEPKQKPQPCQRPLFKHRLHKLTKAFDVNCSKRRLTAAEKLRRANSGCVVVVLVVAVVIVVAVGGGGDSCGK
ncbi:Hypothetical predicted protein [Octopus vulgaris]|uniref:Uncharacterized protein n=1 Tax=Octopus vulgaris TaxID=6645 RepID=A0AA36BI98_OCTVU|nr:Hypothetical predicted protein [Octopus vulgaris]